MRTQEVLSLLSTALLGSAMAQEIPASEFAPAVTNNPTGVAYKASLPDRTFYSEAALEGHVKGYLSGEAAPDGKGVKFTIKVENLPKNATGYLWHIHVNRATDGNCTSTLGHLDPYNRGESPACDPKDPASCQVGDMSGKYGTITSDPYTFEFTDPFTSTEPGTPAYFGNRSFVIHYANKTRLTCADFKLEHDKHHGDNTTTTTLTSIATSAPTGTGSLTTSKPTSTVPVTAGASLNTISISLLSGAVAAMLFAL